MPALRMLRSARRPRVSSLLAVLAAIAAFAVSTPARAEDPRWPRQLDSSSGSILIYQPQPEDLEGDLLTARAAFSLQKSVDATPTFGVLWFTERIAIDRDSSTVTARSLDVTKVRLPGITAAEASRYEKIIEAEAAQWDLSGSLEELQAGLAATERERASVADLGNAPPHIIFAYERAILVAYDGPPTLEPIAGSSLERVANTPYAVVFDPSRRDYYLNGANLWYTAKNPLGPWADTLGVPPAVLAIVPPDTLADSQIQGPPPLVLTATDPTELISTDGPPRYASLVGDELLYVTNTESDVVREVSSQALYVLLAGRWYRAPSPDGPWSFVRGDQLPASFKRIPPDSPKGNILASVAGTDQAEDAIADAEIPQTSAIRRGEHDFDASYDGSPQFQSIDGTSLQYAVNTDAEIIFADGRYYACDQGVWYVSDGPEGPWSVSETRPLGVDDIPPSCPVYNVRYVYIFDTTPDVIYVGYLPGYVGCYPYYGTVVYGTGHRYVPWRGRRHYYSRPTTWGFHARYNPWLSRWSFGCSYDTGFLRVGTRWRSWEQPGQHHGPPPWFGPGGYRRPLLAADRTPLRTRRVALPRSGVADRPPANLYNRPENVVRVDRAALRLPVRQIVRPEMRPAVSPEVRTAVRPPVRPILRPAVRTAPLPNNVLAGKDGKVYQRDVSGNWKVNEGRVWKPAQVPVRPPVTAPAADRGRITDVPRGAARPAERPQTQPAPRVWPTERQVQPRMVPSTRPEPPAISPTPGNLEREYRARERTQPGGDREAPAPALRPAPAHEERPRLKAPTERKR
jgi:hypothetical protein